MAGRNPIACHVQFQLDLDGLARNERLRVVMITQREVEYAVGDACDLASGLHVTQAHRQLAAGLVTGQCQRDAGLAEDIQRRVERFTVKAHGECIIEPLISRQVRPEPDGAILA